MKEEIKPPRSVGIAKVIFLLFSILCPLSLVLEIINLGRPNTSQTLPFWFYAFFYGLGTPLYAAACFAIRKRRKNARLLSAVSYIFLALHVVVALVWFLFGFSGAKSPLSTNLIVGLDIVQLALYLWGASIFLFSPKVKSYFNPGHTQTQSHIPPPPPSFDA